MKKLILAILLAGGIQAHAGNDGGGGSRIESAFRLASASLIQAISSNEAANKLCSGEVIQKGLNSSKIRVVDVLYDLNTGKEIKDQHYDAWTRPGTIQLKKRVWTDY